MTRTLLLFVPSTLAVAGLVWHAWRCRGRRVALTFFPAAFLFGAIRGNVIHWIAVDAQKGVMPYLVANPVAQVFSGSLQVVVGWMFALYVSWWLAERAMERIPALRGDLTATVGLACVGMAALAYATEAGAYAAGWWLWSIPTRNRFFAGVPAVGIAEWFAVGFEFLIPYLLTVCSPYRGRAWPHALWGLYLLHLFLHLFGDPISEALPTQPFVVWHWVSLLTMGGLALTGAGTARVQTEEGRRFDWVMWGTVGLFGAVMAAAQVGIGGRPDLLVSLAPLGLLGLLAASRLPLRWALLAGAGAWAWEGFGLTFLPGPVVAFLLLEGRVRWGGMKAVRAGVCAALVGVAAMGYVYGRAWGERCGDYVRRLEQADAYARQGRGDLAAQEQAAADTLDPADVESYLQAGYALERRGGGRLAMAQYRKAIALEPNFFLGYYDLGIALEAQNDREGAEVAFRRAVEIAPRFYQGHVRLGTLYLGKGPVEQAIGHFQRATEVEPGRPEAYNNLGVAYQRRGQGDLAMAAWQRAIELDPDFADAHANIGDAHLLQGRTDEAVRAYQAALRAEPGHARARQGMTLARLRQRMEGGRR